MGNFMPLAQFTSCVSFHEQVDVAVTFDLNSGDAQLECQPDIDYLNYPNFDILSDSSPSSINIHLSV
jgi:hypothetical protein